MIKNEFTIMIIDDEPTVANSIKFFLDDRGWHTIVFNNAEDALEHLNDKSIRVIVVDIRLGGMSGENFIHKAYDDRKDVHFIISTGSPNYTIDDDLKKIPTIYQNNFKKPIEDLTTLESVIEQLVKS